MFSLENHLQFRKICISCLLTSIYLAILVIVISYKGLLYTVGNGSAFYILILIFVAESIKTFYLQSNNNPQMKKTKKKVSDFAKAAVFLLIVVLKFFIGIILFGAPFLDSHEETLMLSVLMTILTAFPLVAYAGVSDALEFLFGLKKFQKDSIIGMLVNNAVFTIAGAWLGAVVIPLDWNTPWQKWPIPCYLGALGGYLLSNVVIYTKLVLMNAATKHSFLKVIVSSLDSLHFSK